MTKNWIKLLGITKTPVVAKRNRFGLKNIGIVTIQGRPRVFGKLTKGERRAPMTFRAWYGNIEVIAPEYKLDEALALDSIGRYTHEGMGQIQWQEMKNFKRNPSILQKKSRSEKCFQQTSQMQCKN
ncbi:hypothetical protein [Candidatus Borrarchaeum sp.]|uniref:hypothetical protein n=1 Tax=Candidatus Borrarchaeum sp. TaxID=2846742 RepID=UPI00257A4226|nr:hypothetical protein [Candidatus Borrarchaeum sp.]